MDTKALLFWLIVFVSPILIIIGIVKMFSNQWTALILFAIVIAYSFFFMVKGKQWQAADAIPKVSKYMFIVALLLLIVTIYMML
ncbi:MAG: hypothetical protein GF364_17150 [Candidatus Lokiarchaeota archaeon]|nr:hypothetical protein [Candidatus Lokiarchaeota archaeon]